METFSVNRDYGNLKIEKSVVVLAIIYVSGLITDVHLSHAVVAGTEELRKFCQETKAVISAFDDVTIINAKVYLIKLDDMLSSHT